VREQFEELQKIDTGHISWHVIDASQTVEAVTMDIVSIVDRVVKEVSEGKPLQQLWSSDIFDLSQSQRIG
jgi:hypothetical protein